jgi:hypothetical protein
VSIYGKASFRKLISAKLYLDSQQSKLKAQQTTSEIKEVRVGKPLIFSWQIHNKNRNRCNYL